MFYKSKILRLNCPMRSRGLPRFFFTHAIQRYMDLPLKSRQMGSINYQNTFCRESMNKKTKISGNHKYIQTINFNRDEVKSKLNDICDKTGCHFLDNRTIRLHEIDFIGITLWTKIDPWIKHQINGKGKTFGTIFKDFESYQNEFDECFKFLQNKLTVIDNKKVIITHHVPSYKLQHPKYREKSIYDSMFYSDILDSLNLSDVKYWFCDHTHESGFMIHSGTHVVINPYGTPWEQVRKQTKISNKALWI